MRRRRSPYSQLVCQFFCAAVEQSPKWLHQVPNTLYPIHLAHYTLAPGTCPGRSRWHCAGIQVRSRTRAAAPSRRRCLSDSHPRCQTRSGTAGQRDQSDRPAALAPGQPRAPALSGRRGPCLQQGHSKMSELERRKDLECTALL